MASETINRAAFQKGRVEVLKEKFTPEWPFIFFTSIKRHKKQGVSTIKIFPANFQTELFDVTHT